MAVSKGFHPVDFVLFGLTLLVSLVVGLYHGCQRGKQQTTNDFLLGGGQLQAVPVAISMFMSYVSAVLVLGNTAEMYTAGIQYWLASIGSSLAFAFAAVVFVPLFFPLRFTSGNEYYEARFHSKLVRVWAAIMFIISSVIYMGLTMFTPATALFAATGFPIWASILATGAIATIYTTLGGIKAVVWTDTVQGGIMVAGIIAVLIAGSIAVGGISRVWELSAQGGRLVLFNFNPDPTIRLSFWSVIFGRFFISLNYVAGQTAILRYSTLRSLRDARLTALLNIPSILVVYTLTCLCGLTVYAYYADKGCDPLRNKEIASSNQLLPHFIMEVVNYPGLPGVFLAVLFSGALSSISSSLNALAACMWKDLLEWKWHYIAENQKALLNKVLVAVFGMVAVGMAFVAAELGGHVLQATQSLAGGFGGPGLGLFFLGSFFPWANWQGALLGSLTGFGMTAWVSMGAYITRAGGFDMLPTSIANCSRPNITISTTPADYMTTSDYYTSTVGYTPKNEVLAIYKMSYMYNAGWGCLITIIVGIVVSLLTGPTDPSSVDPKLLVPLVNRLCCCLPARWRERCYCGVDFKCKHVDDFVTDDKSKIVEMAENTEEFYNKDKKTTIISDSSLIDKELGYKNMAIDGMSTKM